MTDDKVDLPWLPAGYATALPKSRTENLARYLTKWLDHDGQAPRIEYRRGVVFAESDEDRGDDEPYPRSAASEGSRVCGTHAVWLREYLRKRLSTLELACWQNICHYGAVEYAPQGYVVFSDRGDEWQLDAWVQIYSAALNQEIVKQNFSDVAAILKRESSTRCTSEPAGAY